MQNPRPVGDELHSASDLARRLRLPRLSRRRLAIAASLVGLLWLAWPVGLDAVVYHDTHEYLLWPGGAVPGWSAGRRPPAYPILLHVFGTGAGMVALQVVTSVLCFAAFGHALAGVPGLWLSGWLSLAPAIAWWNPALLTESLSLSLLVGLLALGVEATRRPPGPWQTAAFSIGVAVFGLLRTSNLLVVPFLALPLVTPLRRSSVVVIAVAVVVMAGGVWDARDAEAWRINYRTALRTRVVVDPEARAYFEARGLPKQPLTRDREAGTAWFQEHMSSVYPLWVITRLESYRVAWDWLVPREHAAALRRHHFAKQKTLEIPFVTRSASIVFDATSLPPWLWLGIVLAAPLARWRWRGSPGPLTLWPIALAAGTYAQVFAGYYGSGTEMHRHVLAGTILYRATLAIALAGLFAAAPAEGSAPVRSDDSGADRPGPEAGRTDTGPLRRD